MSGCVAAPHLIAGLACTKAGSGAQGGGEPGWGGHGCRTTVWYCARCEQSASAALCVLASL